MHKALTVLLLLALPHAALAKGPIGLGDLKIGMAKARIETVSSTAAIRLAEPMTPYVYGKNSTPSPGEDKFDTKIQTPWAEAPLEAVLTFRGDALSSIYVKLDEDSSRMLDSVKEQIATKYGVPKVDDTIKEEQCIYRNGSNFKVKSGAVIYTWVETPAKGSPIEARISDIVLEICPSSLRYAMGPIKAKSLTISYQQPKATTANPF